MEKETIKLSKLLAMDMGQLSDWMVGKSSDSETVTLSPQAEQATASCLSVLLDREEQQIVDICKSNDSEFAYDKVDKITRLLNKRAGCGLYSCVVADKLVQIIAKAF